MSPSTRRSYRAGRGPSFPLGKISREAFGRLIAPHLGARRRDVLLGPAMGVDVGAVRLGPGEVGLFTTDPIYTEPALGWEPACWVAFHILANDITTTGHPPTHVLVDLNLPLDLPEHRISSFMRVWHKEALSLGATILGGHTGRYPGAELPILGGATFFARAPARSFAATPFIRPGLSLVMSKGAGIETAVLLACLLPPDRSLGMTAHGRRVARGRWRELSTVREALLAASLGLGPKGVRAMHDAAEGGVLRALQEMVDASGVGLSVDRDRIPIDPQAHQVCRAFGLDPLSVSSGGTLLVALPPGRVQELLARWASEGIEGTLVGRFQPGPAVLRDRSRPLSSPPPDRWYAPLEGKWSGPRRRS
jgi:hydrogenase expression/formation protein HypE